MRGDFKPYRDEMVISTKAEVLAGEPMAVVVTTAAHDPKAFVAPANARVEQSLPHAPIIARAACVVSHGGQGTTQKALASGVPVCVVPYYRDQLDVARRVERADAGVLLHHKRLNPERLRSAVHVAITKRPGAERVARSFAAAGGSSAAAADAVEELLPAIGIHRHVGFAAQPETGGDTGHQVRSGAQIQPDPR
jgi:UDP:flavonoid glycosyltransferase YjiC (YdhE family)